MMKLRNALAMGALVVAIGVSTIGVMAAETDATTVAPRFTLEQKIDILNERVAAGDLTQEEADEIVAAIEANSELCDGTGTSKIGQSLGARFGGGQGKGNGVGNGSGNRGGGRGMGARTGACR
jgi:hypothetical protein